jgi:outer membrane protein OmpA-like peptidoglycan-associated protein
MRLNKSLLISLVLIFIKIALFAQETTPEKPLSDKELWNRAENYAMYNYFDQALADYVIVYEHDNTHYQAAFKVGYCYLQSESQQDVLKAIDYLQYASSNMNAKFSSNFRNKTAPVETLFFLGVAYRLKRDYETAISYFQDYEKVMDNSNADIVSDSQVKQEKDACIEAMKNKEFVDMKAHHININGVSDDQKIRCPVYACEANMLVYTLGDSNIWPPDINYDREYDNSPFDSIYYSYNIDSNLWSTPINISSQIRVNAPILPVTITADGSKLFFVVDNDDNGDIYMSEFKNGKFTTPEYVKGDINTNKWESHASITADGKRLFFTSARKGGYGGLDIYYSDLLDNNTWGEAVNLGPDINTELNEEMPYISKTGTELYFSSESLNTTGGYDVFYSTYNIVELKWSTPQNVGYPFNTPGNDMGYVVEFDLNGTKEFAFCPINSNKRRKGYEECECISFSEQVPNTSIAVVGTLQMDDYYNGIPEDATITVTNTTSGEIIQTQNISVTEGQFQINLPQDEYSFLVTSKDFDDTEKTVVLPKGQKTYFMFFRIDPPAILTNVDNQDLNDINDNNNNHINSQFNDKEISWVLFDFDLSIIKPEYFPDLNILAEYLKVNPDAQIEVHGHCDPFGSYEYNTSLGQRRADAVKDYLVSKGANKDQITTKTFGEERLIANGTSTEARVYDRRVEYYIVKPKTPNLHIVPIKVPDEHSIQ